MASDVEYSCALRWREVGRISEGCHKVTEVEIQSSNPSVPSASRFTIHDSLLLNYLTT